MLARSRLFALLLICLALPLTIAACGGDDDGNNDEDEITEAIETSTMSTDPADCSKYQTENFLEQLEFTTPDETALESCEESAEDASGDPDSVEVSDTSVDGEAATASVAFTGGAFDGATFDVELVKEDDQWKLDRLTDIPVFDLEAFTTALSEALAADPDVDPASASCAVDAFTFAGEEEIKRILLEGDDEAFYTLLAPCG